MFSLDFIILPPKSSYPSFTLDHNTLNTSSWSVGLPIWPTFKTISMLIITVMFRLWENMSPPDITMLEKLAQRLATPLKEHLLQCF